MVYDIEVIFKFVTDKKRTFCNGYRPAHLVEENYLTTGVHHYYNVEKVSSGEEIKGAITFISPEFYPACMWVGKKILMYDGSANIGYATVLKIFNTILEKRESEE